MMVDNVSKERRSEIMGAVKFKDTKPEMIVRRFLYKEGFRYRLHVKELPGKPDIVLRKYKTIIFVNGCFWHGHENCKIYMMPKSNISFWYEKITKNKARDKKNIEELNRLNWSVIIVWECQLRKKMQRITLNRISKVLRTTYRK
ncbi:very short patch repair endonuclease [Carboxylicivirga sp. RSCT41]|uniref:very short patch repair endonuclease n=1 Tax=Carboxylicivirga agarovorans TaxID=3417570 RepID=UPI003D341917